ncbi:DNA polymerase lambda isoform X3 [Alligator sinensis]|uniref:DNA-directed DNA polymerase n=1 Tax=Alligator sinensis TaxID=38654 RepID=A0A3Q0FUX3_ALLSI|nr:DNA polymerase lambda isoform X3 [Alligator sinensis]
MATRAPGTACLTRKCSPRLLEIRPSNPEVLASPISCCGSPCAPGARGTPRPMLPAGIVKAFPKRKKARDGAEQVPPKMQKEPEAGGPEDWLASVTAYVLPAGMGRARAEIFHKHIVQRGGRVCSQPSPEVTHIIVNEGMDGGRALRLLRLAALPPSVRLVTAAWLSTCISERKLLSTAGYDVLVPGRSLDAPERQTCQKPPLGNGDAQPQARSEALGPEAEAQADTSEQLPAQEAGPPAQRVSEDEGSDGEEPSVTPADLEALILGHYPPTPSEGSAAAPPPVGKWVCAQSSHTKKENHNQCITEKLEVLAKAYSVQGDKWRALGYAKAINALKSYHKPVTSYEEACKIPGIGKRMAEKIQEILASGHLRKLDHISESVPVLEVFSNIWGAGVKTAQMWYQQVREAAQALDPGLVCVACGSYRRGKPSCGDVDVLVTHPDGHSHRGIFAKLLNSLRRSGFLTDDLVSQEDGSQKKYLGVCRLPGPGRHHRRLDIIVVPYAEFGCALLYFTGSAHFNRSMRALAKTKGMSLSEHALSTAVVRGPGGTKLAPGFALPTPTERDVFAVLGLPYREPPERDCAGDGGDRRPDPFLHPRPPVTSGCSRPLADPQPIGPAL